MKKIAILAVTLCTMAVAPDISIAQTRGDTQDRLAATDVSNCAKRYFRIGHRGMSRAEVWQMCLEVVAERYRRPEVGIARRVNARESTEIFSFSR